MASTLILSRSPPLVEFTWNEGVIQIIVQSFPNCDLSAISDLANISGDLARPYAACFGILLTSDIRDADQTKNDQEISQK